MKTVKLLRFVYAILPMTFLSALLFTPALSASQVLLHQDYEGQASTSNVSITYCSQTIWPQETSTEDPYARFSAQDLYTLAQKYHRENKKENQELIMLLYQKAAERGYAPAQSQLGACYAKGDCVLQNNDQAVAWTQCAAQQNEPNALYNLGLFLLYGFGITQNTSKGMRYLESAANKKHTTAQCNLGVCYFGGLYVEQDQKKAYELFELATALGDISATSNLGVCLLEGKGTASDRIRAINLLSLAAQRGLPEAQYNLGICYRDGLYGVAKDAPKALTLFTQAAEQNNAGAQHALATMLYHGIGTTQNQAKAFMWFSKAAQQKYADAEYALGVCYLYGEGVHKNITDAIIYFTRAADHGNLDAQGIALTLFAKNIIPNQDSRKNQYEAELVRRFTSSEERATFLQRFECLATDCAPESTTSSKHA